uniref:Keratin-associated protein 20-2-like n=1 Tax=Theropithecus gelada TaxID=9565 RepID=A0A8D2KA13_THEGE
MCFHYYGSPGYGYEGLDCGHGCDQGCGSGSCYGDYGYGCYRPCCYGRYWSSGFY